MSQDQIIMFLMNVRLMGVNMAIVGMNFEKEHTFQRQETMKDEMKIIKNEIME